MFVAQHLGARQLEGLLLAGFGFPIAALGLVQEGQGVETGQGGGMYVAEMLLGVLIRLLRPLQSFVVFPITVRRHRFGIQSFPGVLFGLACRVCDPLQGSQQKINPSHSQRCIGISPSTAYIVWQHP